jgi:hypothetical protein
MALLLTVLALAGCAQGMADAIAGHAGPAYNSGDKSGSDGGGGGGGM